MPEICTLFTSVDLDGLILSLPEILLAVLSPTQVDPPSPQVSDHSPRSKCRLSSNRMTLISSDCGTSGLARGRVDSAGRPTWVIAAHPKGAAGPGRGGEHAAASAGVPAIGG